MFRDFRIATLYVLLPIVALVSLITSRQPGAALSAPGPTRWLLTAIALSYAAWAWMFCIYRYAVPIEMLAPLGIVLALGLLPLSPKLRWSAAALVLAVLQATTVWGTWGRSDWARNVVEFNMPGGASPTPITRWRSSADISRSDI